MNEFSDPEKLLACTQTSAAAAAKWWADRLRDGAGIGDNGARDLPNLMAQSLTRRLRERAPITPEMCDQYEHLLRRGIFEAMRDPQLRRVSTRGWDTDDPDIWVGVDYHPCHMLFNPLIEIGIDEGVADMAALPLKTRMQISPRRVIVSHGYGAEYVEIHGPVWGTPYAEMREYDNRRWELYQRDCRKPWEADIEARYGADWHYGMLREAGEDFGPEHDRWQGPV